jgi:cytochrome c551/c552
MLIVGVWGTIFITANQIMYDGAATESSKMIASRGSRKK